MSIRVTQESVLRTVMAGIQDRSERMSVLQRQLSTQKEVNVPSDSPTRAAVILRLEAQIKALEQSEAAVDTASQFMDAGLTALDSVNEALQTVESISIRANGGNFSVAERQALAEQVNQSLESLVEEANRRFGDKYLFSGIDSDRPAINVTRNSDDEIESVSYGGSETPLVVPISRERNIVAGLNGDEVFIDSGMLQSLISLRDHLRNTAGLSDEELTAATLQDEADIKEAREAVLAVTGRYGARRSLLDLESSQLSAGVLRAKDVLSHNQDADIANVTIELQKESTIYQALLVSSSQILSRSLLDYMS